MRICIVAEGCYPYLTGGVSSWIHSLISRMPEHEFVVLAIAAQEKMKGKFRYELPPNLVEVREVFLDSFLNEEQTKWGSRYRMQKAERDALYALLSGEKVDWNSLFAFLCSPQLTSVTDFLTSKDFFDIIHEVCRNRYSQLPFTEMFWTVRSMILPLFQAIRGGLPEADVYHSVSTGYAGVMAALGKFLYRKPALLTEHGIYTREREEEIIKADWIKGYFKDIWIEHFYSLSDCIYSSADEIVSLFHRNREIQGELGAPLEKIRIIPNGVRASDYASEAQPVKPDGPSVGAVVRVVPIKDIKTMLQSFAITKQEVPDAKFYILGPTDEDEEYYKECLQLVESLQLEDVFFTGTVKVSDYISRMDVLALTSISEGQPLAVLEGMAAGKPFVTTDVGSCRELLYGSGDEFGQAGYVEPVMHVERIGRSLARLLHNPELASEMGRNGQQRVCALYTQEGFIDAYRSLYLSMGGGTSWQASALN